MNVLGARKRGWIIAAMLFVSSTKGTTFRLAPQAAPDEAPVNRHGGSQCQEIHHHYH